MVIERVEWLTKLQHHVVCYVYYVVNRAESGFPEAVLQMPPSGLPNLGLASLNDVLEDVRRITSATMLRLLVESETGWGNAFMLARTIRQMIKAGPLVFIIEDQVQANRCGHRPNKEIVSTNEMVDRIKAAVDARTDPNSY